MNIVIRVDASVEIGSGHVYRCLTLAIGLERIGSEVTFICRKHVGNLNELIIRKGFSVYELPVEKSEDRERKTGYSKWLGADPLIDAGQVKELLAGKKVDWVVVDHYAIEKNWEKIIKSNCNKIMVIDDLANRHHQCDLLLDQNFFINSDERYVGKVQSSCKLLLGPKYALLQPEYSKLRSSIHPRKGGVKNIMVFMGGEDRFNVTEKVLKALDGISGSYDYTVNVVLSEGNANYDRVKKKVMNMKGVTIYSNLPTLAFLMAEADLAIGAGGGAHWERLCLGVPSLIVTYAENQIPVTEQLHNSGLVQYIGDIKNIDTKEIKKQIEVMLSSNNSEEMSKKCMAFCSGNGLENVIKEMMRS